MTDSKILVTGSKGLVGSRFVELYPDKNNLVTPELPDFDLTKPDNVKRIFDQNNPEVIIHFAAYTNVGEAENQRGDQSGICWRVNVTGTQNLIENKPKNCQFIYISTDMVFPGSTESPGPYTEDHPITLNSEKLTWYGYTKAVAEKMASEAGDTIVRIIYPVRKEFSGKSDYLRWPLSQYDQGQLRPAFIDQQVSITFIDELYPALNRIVEDNLTGTFHVSSPDSGTPFEIFSYLLEKSRGVKDIVQQSSLQDFIKNGGNPVRYPVFGGLDCRETQKQLQMKFSPWRKIIDQLWPNNF